MRLPYAAASLLVLTASTHAQVCVHYWDFSSQSDVVGGVATTSVGAPVLAVDPTYGEAYPGSGASLQNENGGTSTSGGHLTAAVWSGSTLFMDWGMNSFSFSYWGYDDLAGDSDDRGVRAFDCLEGTSTGIQLASNLDNDWNFRVDDDQGGALIYNNAFAFQPPADRWYHVTGVVDRSANEVRAYLDGVLQMAIPFSDTTTGTPMTGNVFPTQDLLIGAINGGINAGGAQKQGLDDLAFYEGVLSASNAMGLASGSLTPDDFAGNPTRYCSPGVVNSTGASGVIDALGSFVATDNDVTLRASSVPANSFGYFLTSQTQGMIAQPGGSQGVLCLSGGIGRYVGPGQIQNSGAAGSFSLLLDLTQTPTPTGFVTVVAGETWNFTAWHRDAVGGSATSNFTDAVSVLFL